MKACGMTERYGVRQYPCEEHRGFIFRIRVPFLESPCDLTGPRAKFEFKEQYYSFEMKTLSIRFVFLIFLLFEFQNF